MDRGIRPATLAMRALIGGAIGGALVACVGGASSPPKRKSQLLESAGALPDGRTFPWTVSTNTSRTAWVYGAPSAQIEIHDGSGLVASTPDEGLGNLDVVPFDVAPDRSAALCAATELRAFDGASWSATSYAAITAGGGAYQCAALATRARGDVWMILQPDASVGVPPPDRLCHLQTGAWTCADLPSPALLDTLVLTAQHVWWLSGAGDVLAVDTSLPVAPLAATTVATGTSASWLQADPTAEAVLVTYQTTRFPAHMSADTPPEHVALDGTRTPYAMHSQFGGYADVWLAPDGRALALDVGQGTSCSGGGVYGYTTGGGGCSVDWTQLVLYRLGTGAPVEVAHADYSGGGGDQIVVDVERPDGTYLSVTGDPWYRWP